jgi:hypothetical protein
VNDPDDTGFMVFFHLPGSRVEAIELLPFPDEDQQFSMYRRVPHP